MAQQQPKWLAEQMQPDRGESEPRHKVWFTAPRVVALVLLVAGIGIECVGYLYRYNKSQYWTNLIVQWDKVFLDTYASAATTLIGIALAVFTIDWANERRAERQLKAQLIREMGCTDNGIALRALGELWAHKPVDWVTDGSLKGALLNIANLQRANLVGADLRKAFLVGTNLKGAALLAADLRAANLFAANLEDADLSSADLREADLSVFSLRGADLSYAKLQGAVSLKTKILITAAALRKATMPVIPGCYSQDGCTYDGRFNLDQDILRATRQDGSNTHDQAMAQFYGVPLEAYLAGQEWARENLPQLRREAGLEQKEAVETGGATQPVEPPSAAPSAPVVPPASLLSFTVRRLIGLFWPFGL